MTKPLDAGRIEFQSGRPKSVLPPTPSLIAWVPQGLNALARRTVLDNVLIAPLSTGAGITQARSRALEAIETVGLTHKLSEQARRLSGGELQRVGLARALASGKGIIFADEPSANLDAANTENIAELLDRLTSRATIVVATHDPVLVSAARSAVYMREKAAVRAG
jgi:ABC-type lipoprotein export system ATPase subunit